MWHHNLCFLNKTQIPLGNLSVVFESSPQFALPLEVTKDLLWIPCFERLQRLHLHQYLDQNRR